MLQSEHGSRLPPFRFLAPCPPTSILTEPDASLLFSGARTAYTFTDEPVTDAQTASNP